MVSHEPEALPLTSTSVVVPVHNGASTLAELVRRVDRALGERPGGVEFIVVDDASTDATWDVIGELAEHGVAVRGVRLGSQVGALVAIAAGCSMARGSVVCTIDSDLENSPEDLPRLLDLLAEGNDLVSAVRVNGARRPWHRRLFSAGARWLVSRCWSFAPRDFGCGLKVWRAGVEGPAMERLVRGGGIAWASDLYTEVERYAEVEVDHIDRGHESVYSTAAMLRLGVELVRVRAGRRLPEGGAPYVVVESLP